MRTKLARQLADDVLWERGLVGNIVGEVAVLTVLGDEADVVRRLHAVDELHDVGVVHFLQKRAEQKRM